MKRIAFNQESIYSGYEGNGITLSIGTRPDPALSRTK